MSKITKKQLQEDIKSLESGIAMNWSDMKKIEVRLSRAMTDMATRISNISLQLEGQQRQIHLAADSIGLNKQAIIMLENEREAEPKPQLKQLDQSVFDGVFDWVKSAAVNPDGSAYLFSVGKDDFYDISEKYGFQITGRDKCKCIGLGYDTTDWQNSLIERDIAKELLEVDLSSELTGSELCKAMLARGDKFILCGVSDSDDSDAENHEDDDFLAEAVTDFDDKDGLFGTTSMRWIYAVPINNQGEPLTASEVGL